MKKLHALLLAAICLALPLSVQAITVSGQLESSPAYDFDVFNFNVNVAGGFNLNLYGDTDPYLLLFSGTNVFTSGTFIAQDDDSGGGLDSFIFANLSVGSYTAYITTHGTYWDGFSFQSNHDHNPSNWTLSIDGDASPSSVPDGGSSLLLLGLAMGGLAWFKRSKS